MCEACGSALPPEAEFCPVCAAPAPERSEEHERPAAPEPETQADGVQVTPSAPAPAAAGTPDLEWASPWRRLGALVVDDVVIAIPAVALLLTWVPRVGEGTVTLALVGVQLVGLATWVGMCVLEGRTGWTAGNLVWGLRTVHERSLEPPGVGRALVRRLVEAIGTAMCFFGRYLVAVSALWDDGPRLQGWQDRAASTSMLRVRGGAGGPAAASRGGARPVPAHATSAPAPVAPADDVVGAPAPSEPVRTAAPVPREAPAPAAPPVPVGDTPTPLIAEVPGFSRPTATTWEPGETAAPQRLAPAIDPAPVAPAPEPAAAPEPASPAAPPSPAEPEAGSGVLDADEDVDRTRLAPAPARGELVLVLPGGERVEVTGEGVLGRNPAAPVGHEVAHLVTVSDPSRSVSKTHLGFGLDAIGLWVKDLHSTNGTAVVAPDGTRSPLTPGLAVHVQPGDVVVVGDVEVEVGR